MKEQIDSIEKALSIINREMTDNDLLSNQVIYLKDIEDATKKIYPYLEIYSDCDKTIVSLSDKAIDPWDIYFLLTDIGRLFYLIFRGEKDAPEN